MWAIGENSDENRRETDLVAWKELVEGSNYLVYYKAVEEADIYYETRWEKSEKREEQWETSQLFP